MGYRSKLIYILPSLALLAFDLVYADPFLSVPPPRSAERARPSAECVNVNHPSVPLCPQSGMLSEQFPVAALSVSTAEGGVDWVAEYVRGVFESSPADRLPLAMISARPAETAELIRRLTALAGSETRARTWLSRLRITGARPYNWQQDYFESSFDSTTGRPILRQVSQDYRVSVQDFNILAEALQRECGATTGQPLRLESGLVGGMLGGNLEAVGDFCVIGRDNFQSDQDFQAFSRDICREGEVIEAPSQFLLVGHTDEFYKTIPVPGRRPPCNFAFMIGSPRRGLELLRQNPDARAFNLPESRLREPSRVGAYGIICRLYDELQRSRRNNDSNPNEGPPGRSWFQWFQFRRTYAGVQPDPIRSPARSNCSEMKNSDLLALINSSEELKGLNESIQQEMDKFTDELKRRVSSRYPGCSPAVIEAPQIYHGANNFNNARAVSIFPNLTNGEYINGNYLMPKPVNSVFGSALESDLRRINVRSREIETGFAHRLGGNLHCSSQAIRFCRPRSNR